MLPFPEDSAQVITNASLPHTSTQISQPGLSELEQMSGIKEREGFCVRLPGFWVGQLAGGWNCSPLWKQERSGEVGGGGAQHGESPCGQQPDATPNCSSSHFPLPLSPWPFYPLASCKHLLYDISCMASHSGFWYFSQSDPCPCIGRSCSFASGSHSVFAFHHLPKLLLRLQGTGSCWHWDIHGPSPLRHSRNDHPNPTQSPFEGKKISQPLNLLTLPHPLIRSTWWVFYKVSVLVLCWCHNQLHKQWLKTHRSIIILKIDVLKSCPSSHLPLWHQFLCHKSVCKPFCWFLLACRIYFNFSKT